DSGEELKITPDGDYGLMQVELPPGTYAVRAWFGGTGLRRLASGFSWLGTLLLIGWPAVAAYTKHAGAARARRQ
ncbi:hypothetical protein JW905_16005, partial [bacterium]|nr:hypothetical protein [candidate division CSSED10-310 bacterium]